MCGLLPLLLIIKKVQSSTDASHEKDNAELQCSERLVILGTETLELRRLKSDLLYIYKILFDLMHVEPSTLHINSMRDTSTGFGKFRHAFCVEEIHGRIDERRNFLSVK